MNQKTLTRLYWISTGLLSLLLLISATMYLINTPEVEEAFIALGFPTWIVTPLAIAKILAVIAIVSNKNSTVIEWAYAGLCYNFILALGAHLAVNDGDWIAATVALILLFTSYYYRKRLGY